MAQQTINIGTVANDGTGDPLRTAMTKVNNNFTEFYSVMIPNTTGNNVVVANNIGVNSSLTVNATTTTGNLSVTNNATVSNNLTVTGNVVANNLTVTLTLSPNNVAASGNVNSNNINVTSNTFTNNLIVTTNAAINNISVTTKVQIGNAAGYNFGSAALVEIDASSNGYQQIVIQNANTGLNASGDLVLTQDTGNDSFGYVDLGINSSVYSNTQYTVIGAGDGYLYASDGQLGVGTANNKAIIFHTNGTLAANERMRISGNGNIGIGNATPTDRLRVEGNVSITSANSLTIGNTVANSLNIYMANSTGNVTLTPYGLNISALGNGLITMGNSTINATFKSSVLQIANGSVGNTNLYPAQISLQTNTTVNSTVTASLLQVSNSTSTANIIATGLQVYTNSTVNSTVTASLLQVSNSTSTANIITTGLQVYTNSTVNSTVTASLLQVSNSTSTVNVIATGVQVYTNSTVNTSLTASVLQTANSTGNVQVTPISVTVSNSTAAVVVSNTTGITVSNTGFTLGSSSKQANNGYMWLPNGFLMQWGQVVANATSANITFAVAYSTNVYSVSLTSANSIGATNGSIAYVNGMTSANLSIRSANATTGAQVMWMTIGV